MYKHLRWITLPVAAVAPTALVTQIPGDPAQAIVDRAIRRHGNRFRQAVNRRAVKGILFQDYINHTHAEGAPLVRFDRLFDAGKLVVLSKIRHRNIRVKPLR